MLQKCVSEHYGICNRGQGKGLKENTQALVQKQKHKLQECRHCPVDQISGPSILISYLSQWLVPETAEEGTISLLIEDYGLCCPCGQVLKCKVGERDLTVSRTEF